MLMFGIRKDPVQSDKAGSVLISRSAHRCSLRALVHLLHAHLIC